MASDPAAPTPNPGNAFAFAQATTDMIDSGQWQIAGLAQSLLRETFDEARNGALRSYAVESLAQSRANELERRAQSPNGELNAQRSALVRQFLNHAERLTNLVVGRLESAIDDSISAAVAAHVTGTTPIPGIREGQPVEALRSLVSAQCTALASGKPLAPGVEDYQAGVVTYALRSMGEQIARDVATIRPNVDLADIVSDIATEARAAVARETGDYDAATMIGVDQMTALQYAVQDLVRDVVGVVSTRAVEGVQSAYWQRVADGLGGAFRNLTDAVKTVAQQNGMAAPATPPAASAPRMTLNL